MTSLAWTTPIRALLRPCLRADTLGALLVAAAQADGAKRTALEIARAVLAKKRAEEKEAKKVLKGKARMWAERTAQLSRLTSLSHALTEDILELIYLHARAHAGRLLRTLRMSCKAWHASLRTHIAPHAALLVWLSHPHAKPHIMPVSRVAPVFAAYTRHARDTLKRTELPKRVWARWGGRRVRVPWPEDGEDVSYEGTVERVFPSGNLRVRLDAKVGQAQSQYVTIASVEPLPDESA